MSDEHGEPWWSSGVEDLDDVTDPFAAHRAARSGGSADTDGAARDTRSERPWDVPWEDWDDRDPRPPDGAQRSSVEDALEALQALARFVASRTGTPRSGLRPHDRDQSCRACPWCIAVRSLGDARPEVVDHLDEALRHLVAAARAWVDAAESRGRWEPIPLDDDEEPNRG